MRYKYLIFDVDGTLLNFSSAYLQAQQAVAETLGISFSQEFVQMDEKLSWELWDEFGLSHVEDETVQQNYHSLYDAYLRKHFACIAQAFGVRAETDAVLHAYYTGLSSSRKPMEPDTLALYEELSQQHTMIIVTNGLGQVQRSRLAGLSAHDSQALHLRRGGLHQTFSTLFQTHYRRFGLCAQ